MLLFGLALLLPGAVPQVADLAALEKKFSIQVEVSEAAFELKTLYAPITGAAAPPEAVESYGPLLAQEFGLYPPELVKRVRLRRIVLCSQLAYDGQLRAAIPDFQHHTLFLDVARGAATPLYQRRVIHHEFFHIVDLRDDGKLYEDVTWSALNPEGFTYGRGGINAQGDARMSLWTEEYPGFLTLYGRTGVEEDKAELFSFLLMHPADVAARSADDECLRVKVERLRALLTGFEKRLDANFWKRVATLERPPPMTRTVPAAPAREER